MVPKELVLRAQRGDIDAFEHIYRLFAEASYTMAYRICGQHTLAEDAVHDAFIKVMKNIKGYRHEGSFSGWCRKIVTCETINRVKAHHRVHLVSDEVLSTSEDINLFEQNWLEACLDVEELIQKLTPLSRAVFLLHEIEGYKHKEIAEMFGKSVSFSKVTLNRAYITLKQMLVAEQEEQKYAP